MFEPLFVMLHLGGTSHAREEREGEGEDEDEEMEEEVEDVATMDDKGDIPDTVVGLIWHIQHSKAPRRKKAMLARTPQSKLISDLMVDNARDMYAQNATTAFCDMRKDKAKKLYSEYAPEETIIYPTRMRMIVRWQNA